VDGADSFHAMLMAKVRIDGIQEQGCSVVGCAVGDIVANFPRTRGSDRGGAYKRGTLCCVDRIVRPRSLYFSVRPLCLVSVL
jgi:hypothetical protein